MGTRVETLDLRHLCILHIVLAVWCLAVASGVLSPHLKGMGWGIRLGHSDRFRVMFLRTAIPTVVDGRPVFGRQLHGCRAAGIHATGG